MPEKILPDHPPRQYSPVNLCIYCGSNEAFSDEHIIPYALGGRWVLPMASCVNCSKVTSTFEQTCLRTMLGPLRIYFNMRTRRPKKRPKKLPLKVKYDLKSDWIEIDVEQKIYPFLVSLPLYGLPDEISGMKTENGRNSATGNLWLRGGNLSADINKFLEEICRTLGVAAVMPTTTTRTHEFCLMLAKIAHSFAVAELGINSFQAFIPEIIMKADTSNRVQYIGGLLANEPKTGQIHEVSFDSEICAKTDVIVVRIRLLALLELPTYYVAVGKRLANVSES